MLVVPTSLLQDAITLNRCVNGARQVLYGRAPRDGAFLPPFVQAAFEVAQSVRTRSPVWLSVADFERLSLVARGQLSGVATHVTARSHPAYQGRDPADFPVVSAKAILEVLGAEASRVASLPLPGGGAGVIDAGAPDRLGLQLVGCRITGSAGESLDLRQVNTRRPISLRLIGCVVDCPIAVTNCEMGTLDLSGSAITALNAAGLKARGSVRLRRMLSLSPVEFGSARVSGVFDASDVLIMPWMRHPTTQTFSPERGVLNLGEATFENDVYLTRARIWGGLNLADAVMERSVFMTQAVVRSPLGVLERLAADIVHSARPASGGPRERWRSFPFHAGDGDGDDGIMAVPHLLSLRDQSRELSEQLHDWRTDTLGANGADDIEHFIQAEVVLHPGVRTRGVVTETPPRTLHASASRIITSLGRAILAQPGDDATETPPAPMEPLVKMLFESMRASTTAIWGDGLKVHGRVFADRLKAMGRLRLRYASIGDGLHLKSAILRSPGTIHHILAQLKAVAAELRRESGRRLHADRLDLLGETARLSRAAIRHAELFLFRTPHQAWSHAPPDGDPDLRMDVCALDIREARIGGCLELNDATGMLADSRGQSALIEGVISGERVEIGGQVAMNHAVFAAPSDVDVRSNTSDPRGIAEFHALRFQNAKIGGDLDLRNTRGLRGVNLDEATIGGGFLLSSKWGLLRRDPPVSPDALPEAPEGPFWSMRRIRRVLIWKFRSWWTRRPGEARDARVTCRDRATGLRGVLNLRSAVIAGDASLIYHPDQGPIIRAELLSVGRRLDIYPPAPPHDEVELDLCARAFDDANNREEAYLRNLQFSAEGLSNDDWPHVARRKPYIDLRHASAVIFCHPWPAWPHAGGLNIDGFAYRRSSDIGPLAPHAFPNDEYSASEGPVSRTRRLGRAWLVVLALAGLAGTATFLWQEADRLPWAGAVVDALQDVGPVNVALAVGLGLGLLVWGASAQLAPKLAGTRPLAIPYLLRQLPGRARYRTRGAITRALDPYVRASKVLLDEGRTIPSQLVEVERIKQRRNMLSFRHHFVAKSFLLLVEKLTRSGFHVARAVVVTYAIILAAALISSWCYANGHLVEKAASTHTPEFLALAYAADLVVPLLDIGQADAWTPTAPPQTPWRWLYFAWPALFSAVGVFMTTVIGAALAARVQTVFARTSE